MPTYVYACDTCGSQFEQFQSFKDEPVRTCPRCDASVRRVFQPVGIVFKGAGWYITDSRKSENASVSADAAQADIKPEAKTEAAETKPETKPEAKPEVKAESKSETTKSSDAKPATA